MTFETIAQRIIAPDLSEVEIDDYRRFCASWLFTLNETYGRLQAAAALWVTKDREKYGSQAETERAWEATKEGQQMIKTKYRIRAVEALSDALEHTYWLRNREWKEADRL